MYISILCIYLSIDHSFILIHNYVNNLDIPTDYLIPKNRRCRNQHSVIGISDTSASTNAYYTVFPQTIRDWNELPDSLIVR